MDLARLDRDAEHLLGTGRVIAIFFEEQRQRNHGVGVPPGLLVPEDRLRFVETSRAAELTSPVCQGIVIHAGGEAEELLEVIGRTAVLEKPCEFRRRVGIPVRNGRSEKRLANRRAGPCPEQTAEERLAARIPDLDCPPVRRLGARVILQLLEHQAQIQRCVIVAGRHGEPERLGGLIASPESLKGVALVVPGRDRPQLGGPSEQGLSASFVAGVRARLGSIE